MVADMQQVITPGAEHGKSNEEVSGTVDQLLES